MSTYIQVSLQRLQENNNIIFFFWQVQMSVCTN